MATKLLRMEHINKSFPGVTALSDVEFSLEAGSIHALLGENGAGKSTLIKVLTGVEKMDGGRVFLDGNEIHVTSPFDAQKKGISTVYQEVNLCPDLSVAENIYIGREPIKRGHIDWKKINADSRELIKEFDLDLDVTEKLGNFPVAVQQMIAIARAVDIKAKILILDEPTSSLSQSEVEKLFNIMRELKKRGLGIVFVTHFLDQVYEVTDTITVLRNGGYVGTYKTSELEKPALIGKMLGKDFDSLAEISVTQREAGGDLERFLDVEDAGTSKIKNLSFSLNKGEVSGLSGLLGSGRTETARLIFGADKMTEGHIKIRDKEVSIKNPLDAIRSDIAFCSENRKTEGIIGELSIMDNIIIALQAKRGLMHVVSKKEAAEIADKYIKELNIKTPSRDQKIKNLSGGNQQKVLLARWLATNPELLIMDEPTRGIDIGAKAEIQRIVVDLAKTGMSCLFISSELEEMQRCCNTMYVLRDKKIVDKLSGDNITEANIMKSIAGEGEA